MLKKSFYLVLKDIRNYVRQYSKLIVGVDSLIVPSLLRRNKG